MKCPYRKEVKFQDNGSTKYKYEYFMDCIKEECPFYVEAGRISNKELCKKVMVETNDPI